MPSTKPTAARPLVRSKRSPEVRIGDPSSRPVRAVPTVQPSPPSPRRGKACDHESARHTYSGEQGLHDQPYQPGSM
eukprot:3344077-Lingulodinium_polyedra.AAC.1